MLNCQNWFQKDLKLVCNAAILKTNLHQKLPGYHIFMTDGIKFEFQHTSTIWQDF